MSLYRANWGTFQAVDNLLQRDEQSFDCGKVVEKMLHLTGAVQQMIITHLIFLYSHFAPAKQRMSYYKNSNYREEASARRGMYDLRQVVHALAHNDGDQPRAEKYFKVKLSVWQEYLLQHFERLAPFPQDATTEEEVLTLSSYAYELEFRFRNSSDRLKPFKTAKTNRNLSHLSPSISSAKNSTTSACLPGPALMNLLAVSRDVPARLSVDILTDDLVNVPENASQRLAAHQQIRQFEEQEAYLKRKCAMAREQGECLLKGERLVIKCTRKADGSFRYSFDTLM